MKVATAHRRVVLYGRTSEALDGRSVDGQLGELRTWAAATGRVVVAELRDDDIGASRFSRGRARPGWQKAMELVSTGQTDELAAWEVSRSTRDRAVWAALISACIEARVDLAVNGKVHDPADPDDGFVLDLGAALAVREAGVISKRTRRGKNARAAGGHPAGSVPYGYRRVLDPETGRPIRRELHPEQAPIVREIVTRLLAREPAGAIARDLTRRGVPTGVGEKWLGRHLKSVLLRLPGNDPLVVEIAQRLAAGEQPKAIAADLNARGIPKPIPSKWVGGNLRILAARPTYAGLRVHQGRVLDDVRGTWPPIITEAEHHQLVALFADPARDKFRNPTHAKHLGTGIYRCGRPGCDGRMRVIWQSAGRPPCYVCRDCYRVSRVQAPVDEIVEAHLVAFLSRPDVLAELTDSGDTEAAEAAAAEVVRLKAKLRAARQAWDDDVLSLEEYADMKARTEPKIRAAEQRARPRHLPAVVADLAGPHAATRWKATPITGKRAALAALLDVTILPAGKGKWRFDPDLVRVERRGALEPRRNEGNSG